MAIFSAVLPIVLLMTALSPFARADISQRELDTDFSGNGKHTSADDVTGGGRALGLLSTGFSLMAGGDNDVTRLQSFDTEGLEAVGSHTTEGSADALVITPGGRVITAGTAGTEILLQAFDATTLEVDTSFAGTGFVTTNTRAQGYKTAGAYAMALQTDGKIVVAGYVQNGSFEDFLVLRYNDDGSLDATFNPTGTNSPDARPGLRAYTVDFGRADRAYGVAIHADGKIVVVGESGGRFAMIRLEANGDLDTSFGDNGSAERAGKEAEARAVIIAPDGTIIVAGSTFVIDPNSMNCLDSGGRYCEYRDFHLSYWDNAGILTGSVTTDINGRGNDDEAHALTMQDDGMIVAVGTTEVSEHVFSGEDESFSRDEDFAVIRVDNMALDTTFGVDGTVITPFDSANDKANSVVMQADGKILVSGRTGSNSAGDFAIARYGTVEPEPTATPTATATPDPPPEDVFCFDRLVTINMNLNGGDGTGTAGDDVILGTPGNDTIDGIGGDDRICGGDGDDDIRGGEGNDSLQGASGEDTLDGGDGDDRLFGAQGADTMSGGAGNDTLHGNRGADMLFGGDGNDRIFGYSQNDEIHGGAGDDKLHGNFGDDLMFGDAGSDRMFGYGDNDTMHGGADDDLMGGNFGNDVMNGDAGNDTMYGSDGNDTVNGGDGDDALEGNSSDDIVNGGEGNDSIDGGINNDICNGDGGVDTSVRCETINGVP